MKHEWVVTDDDGRQRLVPGKVSRPPVAVIAQEVNKQAAKVHAIRVRQQQAEQGRRLDALAEQVEQLAAKAPITSTTSEADDTVTSSATVMVDTDHPTSTAAALSVARWQIEQWRREGWTT